MPLGITAIYRGTSVGATTYANDCIHFPQRVSFSLELGVSGAGRGRRRGALGRHADPGRVRRHECRTSRNGQSALAAGAGSRLEERHDLARTGMPAQLRLLEHRCAIGEDLEAATARPIQLDFCVRKTRTNLGRQTGGPRFVVSHRAVFDRDVHGRNRKRARGIPSELIARSSRQPARLSAAARGHSPCSRACE